MARAYIVLARNDLEDSQLQVLDLKPNPTPSKGSVIYDPPSQGGYQTHYLHDGVNNAVGALALPAGPSVATYGLAGYFLDTVEVAATDRAITTVMANFMATDIGAQVAAGGALTAAWINARLVVRVGAGTALSEGNGTATVEEILRILAGERYRVPANAVLEDGVPHFISARRGGFVTAANVEVPSSIRTTTVSTVRGVTTTNTRSGVRGRRFNAPLPYLRPGVPLVPPVNTGLQDNNYTNQRVNVETGHLHLSAIDGALAKLKSSAFTWQNPNFAYNAGAVTAEYVRATDIGLNNIPDATYVGRAVVVYDALGNVI